jgi:hypothetical protein
MTSPSCSIAKRQDTDVRPGRPDIAAPDLPAEIEWIGPRPPKMPQLAAKGPVLVHFVDFAQLNSVRSLPYVREWHSRYAEAGLTVLGVQAPRFPFGADPQVVGAGLKRLGVEHPVAIDADRELWFDYGCRGWPSLFLWGRGGVLRWYHFGEGEYTATEEAIQEALREIDALHPLPSPLKPLRPTDAPGAAVMPPTPELFPAGEGEALEVANDSEPIEVSYEAGGAYATLEGQGALLASLDGGPAVELAVDGAGLFELADHARHESHLLRIEPAAGAVAVWSLSFAAGVP